ncbi:unnamed protein product [Trichobilharzia szidati]|nr:unnamed protein product [Trichobilharzia szidati]
MTSNNQMREKINTSTKILSSNNCKCQYCPVEKGEVCRIYKTLAKLPTDRVQVSFGKIAKFNQLLNKAIVNDLSPESKPENSKISNECKDDCCTSFYLVARNSDLQRKFLNTHLSTLCDEADFIRVSECKYSPEVKLSETVKSNILENSLNVTDKCGGINHPTDSRNPISCTDLHHINTSNNYNGIPAEFNSKQYLSSVNTYSSPSLLNYKLRKCTCHNCQQSNRNNIYQNKCVNTSVNESHSNQNLSESKANDSRLSHFLIKMKRLLRKMSTIDVSGGKKQTEHYAAVVQKKEEEEENKDEINGRKFICKPQMLCSEFSFPCQSQKCCTLKSSSNPYQFEKPYTVYLITHASPGVLIKSSKTKE